MTRSLAIHWPWFRIVFFGVCAGVLFQSGIALGGPPEDGYTGLAAGLEEAADSDDPDSDATVEYHERSDGIDGATITDDGQAVVSEAGVVQGGGGNSSSGRGVYFQSSTAESRLTNYGTVSGGSGTLPYTDGSAVSGGSGGHGVLFSGDGQVANTGTISGGDGADGMDAGEDTSQNGGDGGNAGGGVYISGMGIVTNAGNISGGRGGDGGNSAGDIDYYYGGRSRSGGTGLYLGGGGIVDNDGSITGGDGGEPGEGRGGRGGSSGGGGLVASSSGNVTFTNSGAVMGGSGNAGSGGGRGGSGGTGARLGGDEVIVTNTGSIHGGTGGESANIPGGFGGGDGGWGLSLWGEVPAQTTNSGTIAGGDGGSGARGGSGGRGLQFEGEAVLTNTGTISGGNGGDGDEGDVGEEDRPEGEPYTPNDFGGSGGGGLTAFGFGGQLTNVTNGGTIAGGNGGSSRNSAGGQGGYGVRIDGGNLTNRGTIKGGDAGTGGEGAPWIERGGVGVLMGEGILRNSGTISGGLDANGERAPAVEFGDGTNCRVVVENGAVFVGAVDATNSDDDTLSFGGTEDQTFDASTIADRGPVVEEEPEPEEDERGFGKREREGEGEERTGGATDRQFQGFETVEVDSGGKVTFVGAAAYTQDTVVKNGTLAVNGNLSSTTIRVEVGGSLQGIGTMGTVVFAPGSVHAPGNSIGTQTFNGTYSLRDGILEIEVTPGVASDQVVVNGSVEIGGSTLRVLGLGETFSGPANANHVIVLNDGTDSVMGVFNSVENQLAFYEVEVALDGGDGNDIELRLVRNGKTFVDVVTNPTDPTVPSVPPSPLAMATLNQLAVARVLDAQGGTADFDAVRAAIMAGTADDARAAIDQLAGDVHAAVPHVHRSLQDRIWSSLSYRLSSRGNAGSTPSHRFGDVLAGAEVPAGAYIPDAKAPASKSPVAGGGTSRVWAEAVAGTGSIDADGAIGSAETGYDWGGGMVGYEAGSGPLVLGGYFQYADVTVDQDLRRAWIEGEHVAAGIYGGYEFADDWRLSGHFGASWLESESRRRLVFGGLNRTAVGEYDDLLLSASLEVAKTLGVGERGWVEPFAGITGRREYDGAFAEKGAGAANLLRGSDTDYFADSVVGVRFGTEWESRSGAWRVNPRAQLGWQHRYGDTGNDFAATFAGTPVGFVSTGTDSARDAFVGSVGVETEALESGVSLYVDYRFGVSSEHNGHTFSGGFSFPW